MVILILRLIFADRETLTETDLQNERAHTTQTKTQTQTQTLSFLHLWKLARMKRVGGGQGGSDRGSSPRTHTCQNTLSLPPSFVPSLPSLLSLITSVWLPAFPSLYHAGADE
jgi:hypothetical protein